MSNMPRLEQVLRGVKLAQAKDGKKGKERLPISVELLDKIRHVWQRRATEDAQMLWATASLCFFGFFRSGELTIQTEIGFDASSHLTFSDVSIVPVCQFLISYSPLWVEPTVT